MKKLRVIKSALKAICRNPTRTFLTTLGIVIGIAAVIALMEIGAGAQLGIFVAFVLAILLGFSVAAAAAIAMIGGADGPTAIYVTKILSESYLPAIAIAAYSYMALIPIIQKPLMRLLTTKKERVIKMEQLRTVSKLEKVLFPLIVTLVVGIILPSAIALLGMLMLGNLFRESGVVERLSSQVQNGLMNTITVFLGISVGCKATGEMFLALETLEIIGLGLLSFVFGTIGGLLVAKLMCKLTKGKINPLIGSAGVSAVPMETFTAVRPSTALLSSAGTPTWSAMRNAMTTNQSTQTSRRRISAGLLPNSSLG